MTVEQAINQMVETLFELKKLIAQQDLEINRLREELRNVSASKAESIDTAVEELL